MHLTNCTYILFLRAPIYKGPLEPRHNTVVPPLPRPYSPSALHNAQPAALQSPHLVQPPPRYVDRDEDGFTTSQLVHTVHVSL
jgi:hypothetical protein